MGNLPTERLEPGYPFIRSGVDYAGAIAHVEPCREGGKTNKMLYLSLRLLCYTRNTFRISYKSN